MAEIVERTSESAVVARELVVVFSRLRRRLREVATLDDLTPSQTSVLSRLSKDGDASMSDLAAAERVRPQSMAATLAALDQHGLINRRPDPEDGRRQLIGLSDLGRARVDGSRQAREEWLVQALDDDFTEDERRAVANAMHLLDRLTL
jgi:DNA-binding MarR family transcriptional regulator